MHFFYKKNTKKFGGVKKKSYLCTRLKYDYMSAMYALRSISAPADRQTKSIPRARLFRRLRLITN